MRARAKHDVRYLMAGNRFSNFVKGNEYRVSLRDNEAILMDEDKMGYSCELEEFYSDFEIVEDSLK